MASNTGYVLMAIGGVLACGGLFQVYLNITAPGLVLAWGFLVTAGVFTIATGAAMADTATRQPESWRIH